MNTEAEGRRLSSQIKTDEYTAWTCLPKILHDDQFLRIAHLSVTSALSAAACSSLRPCDPPAPYSNAAPYTCVLMLDMVREAWEDQSRHRQDV